MRKLPAFRRGEADEMAHMLCGHPALVISPQQARILLRQSEADPSVYEHLLLRSAHPDEMELEAETLTALIQERVLRFSTLEKLTTVISSDEDIAEYLRAMELA